MRIRISALLLLLWCVPSGTTGTTGLPVAWAQTVPECEDLTYESLGGTVPAVLCLPPGATTARTGIVYLHGSGGPNEVPPPPYGGIGARLEAGPLRLGAVFPDSPAEAAGLRADDEILVIDGLPAAELSVPNALPLVRGEAGSTVALTIARSGQPGTEEVIVGREIIDPVPPASVPMPFDLVPNLAGQGFVTLGIHYFALTPAPGPDPESFNGAPPEAYEAAFPTWLHVVNDGLSFLQTRTEVDPARMGLVGWSRGGQVALQAASLDARYGAVVAISSQVNEPILASAADLPPVLILHGTADQTNPIAHAFTLRDALTAAGRPHELAISPNGDHFWRDQQGREGFDRLVGFLRQTLIPDRASGKVAWPTTAFGAACRHPPPGPK